MANNKSHNPNAQVNKLKIDNKDVLVEAAICDGEGNQINTTYQTKAETGSIAGFNYTFVDGVLTLTPKN